MMIILKNTGETQQKNHLVSGLFFFSKTESEASYDGVE